MIVLGIIFILLFLTIQIINIIGYVNITKFAFGNESSGESRSLKLTNAQMTFIRISVVLQILTVLGVFSSYLDGFRDKSKSKEINTFTFLIYILYSIGLFFIAKFGFGATNNGDERIVDLTDTDMIFVKITAAMQWASIVFISILIMLGSYLYIIKNNFYSF
jgi:hypothetical protein